MSNVSLNNVVEQKFEPRLICIRRSSILKIRRKIKKKKLKAINGDTMTNTMVKDIVEDEIDIEDVIDRVIKGDIFFLGNDEIVNIQEKNSGIKFERTGIDVKLRNNKYSRLYYIKKDEKLKDYSSDIWKPAGANWETLIGFYFEEDIPIKVHVYYIGSKFDPKKLSEMVYSLFTNVGKYHIKISKIAFKYVK